MSEPFACLSALACDDAASALHPASAVAAAESACLIVQPQSKGPDAYQSP